MTSTLIPSTQINVYDTSLAEATSFFQGYYQDDGVVRDPLITGYAFIKWINVPSWVTQVYPGFVALTEKNLRSFGGIQDIDMTSVYIMEGFTNSETHFAGGIQRFQGFTMSHREYSGSPIRNTYSHWVSGIRDPVTGIARYTKDYGGEYSAASYTGELLYIMTRPDADNVGDGKIIEFACLYTMVMPTKIPLQHLNFTSGTNEAAPEIEQTFTGVPHISSAVDDLAVSYLSQIYPFVTMGDFTPQNAQAPGGGGGP